MPYRSALWRGTNATVVNVETGCDINRNPFLWWKHRDSNSGPSACKTEFGDFYRFLSFLIICRKILYFNANIRNIVWFCFVYFCLFRMFVCKLCAENRNLHTDAILERRNNSCCGARYEAPQKEWPLSGPDPGDLSTSKAVLSYRKGYDPG